MSAVKLLLSAPVNNVARLKQRLAGTGYYLYLGQDFMRRRHLEAALGRAFVRLDIAKLQEEVANTLRNEHIQWIDRLNRRYGRDMEWWFGAIAARNIYTSNLFQYACYLEILERLWTVPGPRPVLIFVESGGLLKAIQKWAADKGVRVETFGDFSKRSLVIKYFLSFLKLGYFFGVLAMRFMAAYVSRRGCRPKDLPRGKSAIVDAFVHDFSLDDQGNFHDVNFLHLNEYLTDHGLAVLVHPVLYGFHLNYFSIYRRMRRSPAHFLIPEDHLQLADYFKALRYPLRTLRRTLIVPRFRNFDLADIVKEDLAGTLADSSSLWAVLIFCWFKRLGDSALSPELIINWYENQVIDKALIAGARQAFPRARVIGAQPFHYSPNLLYLFPLPSEVEAQVTPHVILAMSDHLCQVAQTFTAAVPCYPAASLRYGYLFQGRPERSAAPEAATVVIMLPYDMMESLEMLETVARGLDNIREDVRLWIKCHPCYSAELLKRSFGEQNWPVRFELYQGSVQEALQHAAVVISSNSSTMVEAAAWGIPVIFLGRQTVLNQNYLGGVTANLVTECFTEHELVEGLNRCLNAPPAEIQGYRQEGENIMNLFFSPPNAETMRPFLGEN